MVSQANRCMGRETGPGSHQDKTMKCPKCQTPMEGGYIEDHIWYSILTREHRFEKVAAQVAGWFSRREAHSIIALRCPDCAHIELTAP